MATITAPLDEAVAFLVAEAEVRAGFAALADRFRPLVLSSGFHETIEPILAREGVEVDLIANRVDARPDGWRVLWRDARAVPRVRRPLQASRAARRPAARLRRRRLLRPLRRARGRPRLRAPRARRLPRLTKPALRAVRDLRRRCCCAYLSRTTSRSRPSASAPSASTSRTSGTRAASTAWSARARCGSRRRPAASTSSRSTPRRGRSSRSCSGSSSTSTPFTAWAAAQPVLDRARPEARGLPPAARAGSVREPGHVDHRAAGLALRGVRDPHPADRALRRAAAGSRTASRPASALAAASEDELVALGFSRRKAEYVVGLARAELDLDALAELPDDEVRARLVGDPRARPVDGRVVPRAPPRAAARVAGRRPRPAQGGRSLLRSRRARARRRASIPSRTSRRTTCSTGLRVAPPMNIRRATIADEAVAPRALGGVRARGPGAAGHRARDVGGGVGRRRASTSRAARCSSPRTTRAPSAWRAPAPPDRGRSHLVLVYVRPRARRRGVAKALVRAASRT